MYFKVHIFWEGHKICEIFTLLLSYVVPVKSKVKISQNFVAFSEYMNFKRIENELGNSFTNPKRSWPHYELVGHGFGNFDFWPSSII